MLFYWATDCIIIFFKLDKCESYRFQKETKGQLSSLIFSYYRFPLICTVPLICYTLVTFDTTCLQIRIKCIVSYSAK